MVKDSPAINEFAWPAQMVETGANIGIFPQSPALILLVPPVDIQKILFPHGHVAADDSALAGIAPDDGKGQPESLGGTAEFAGEKKTESTNFLLGPPGSRSSCVEITAAALNPVAGFGKGGVVFHITGMGDAVGIGEDEVIALSLGESAVKDDVFSEALVLVPKVSGGARQGGEKSFDEGAGFGAGTVVGDENFPWGRGLIAKSGQAQFERADVIVGADDDGDFFWIDHGWKIRETGILCW